MQDLVTPNGQTAHYTCFIYLSAGAGDGALVSSIFGGFLSLELWLIPANSVQSYTPARPFKSPFTFSAFAIRGDFSPVQLYLLTASLLKGQPRAARPTECLFAYKLIARRTAKCLVPAEATQVGNNNVLSSAAGQISHCVASDPIRLRFIAALDTRLLGR